MNSNAQIVALYEDIAEPMSVADICKATDLDEVTVKMALAQGSPKYNKELQNNAEEFNATDKDMAKMVLKQLMLTAETPNVRFRAARLIFDEAKGRNDLKGVKNVNVNVTLIKQMMDEVKMAAEKAVNKTIDIPAQFEHMKQITA